MSDSPAPGHGVWLEREGRAGLPCRLHRVDAEAGWWLVARGDPPRVGDSVHLSWGTPTGAWVAPSRVRKVVAPGPSPDGAFRLHAELLMEPPGSASRCERRRFLRVRCAIPFSVLVDGREVLGVCRDLSASGLRGTVREPLRSEVDVGVELSLPLGSVGVPGRVLRVAQRRDRGEVAVSFFADERSEDRIVAFVLDRERSILRSR